MADNELNAVVLQSIEVSPGLMILRVQPDGWDAPEFEAGQYGVLGLPGSAKRFPIADPEDETPDPDKIIKRAYSIASSSKSKEYVEFFITLVRSGSLTPRLFALNVGDHVFLSPKFKGVFTIDKAPEDANIIMIATGTGLAPYMSIIRSKLSLGNGRRFAIIHGARHSYDLGYRSELMTLTNICDTFTYMPVISRPEEEHINWGGLVGHAQDIWKDRAVETAWGFKPTPENTHFFLCGAPGMVDDMTKILESEGYKEHKRKDPGQIHLERWW